MASLPSGVTYSQAHPEPNRVAAAVDAGPSRLDGLFQLWMEGRLVGGEDGPKQGVVVVSTRVVAHGLAVFGDFCKDVLEFGKGDVCACHSCVQVFDIARVMLGEVNFHRLGIDEGLKCCVGVRQGRLGKLSGCKLST
jgi:hypothetical protein